jgi:AcrR family transcriptional regulator
MSREKNPTHTRILQSTWKLLEAGKGNATRMSDIAKAAKISRQALYLHFPNRAELLLETTHYVDEIHDIDSKMAKIQNAKTGVEHLTTWVDVWGHHIPEIYGIAKALLAMKDNDEAAQAAWNDRMQAVRRGCAAAVSDLNAEGALKKTLSENEATDILWSIHSIGTWEQFRVECGWSQAHYIEMIQKITAQALLRSQ